MSTYTIGIDFGTLSARALIAEVDAGRELAVASMDYPHGVMDVALPDGTKLAPDWALQHPRDYLDCLNAIVPEVIDKSGVDPKSIIGIGIDFTSCTLLALGKSGAPLCFDERHESNPHAYVKLWKHHAAQSQADRITLLAKERNEPFLARYGSKISSEWVLPKILQVLDEAPALYDETALFLEATDWIVGHLTGEMHLSNCAAGFKSLWHKTEGYPSEAFLCALDPRLTHLTDEKLSKNIHTVGTKAGELTEEAAAHLGLTPGTAIAIGHLDAHVSMPAAGMTQPGDLLLIIGTSTCHIFLSDREVPVPGICGVVEDGAIPGLFAYEAGQSATGDLYGWLIDNLIPAAYENEAATQGVSLHALLTEKAARLTPGESGLLALDWWNGNRSVLNDGDLTGLLIGMTLQTKPEEIYRALIEATAFGSRMILETFEESGLPVRRLRACGGISKKNALLMQIYADVLNREIPVVRSPQAPALGSALFGALAAGSARGGYDSIEDASREMSSGQYEIYRPIPENVQIYEQIYDEYKALYNAFGHSAKGVMKRLKQLKTIVM